MRVIYYNYTTVKIKKYLIGKVVNSHILVRKE